MNSFYNQRREIGLFAMLYCALHLMGQRQDAAIAAESAPFLQQKDSSTLQKPNVPGEW